METVVFAIDLGNSYVKMKSERAEYNFPAQYLMADNVLERDTILSGSYGNDFFQLEEEECFIWGNNLEAYNMPEKLIHSRAHSNRFEQRKVRRLLEFALAKLASDYPEAKKEGIKVHLVLGLPISQNHKKDKTRELLSQYCVGLHLCKVNGVDIKVTVPTEEEVTIIPQYMGTVINLAFDSNLKEIKEVKDGKLGILDIGSETLLANTVNRMVPGVWGTERLEGIKNLIWAISSKTNIPQTSWVEQLLFNEKTAVSYGEQSEHNISERKDIVNTVLVEIGKYSKFVIAPLLTDYFSNLNDVDSIFITGGGAHVLSQEALKSEVGDDYFKRLIFIEEPEMANVRGFYKYGQLFQDKDREKGVAENIPVPISENMETVAVSHHEEANLSHIVSNIEKLKEEMDALKEEVDD